MSTILFHQRQEEQSGLEPSSFFLSFRDGVSLVWEQEDAVLETPQTRIPLGNMPRGVFLALQTLSQGATESELTARIANKANEGGVAHLYYYLSILTTHGMVCHTVREGQTKLATLVPISPEFRFELPAVLSDQSACLSRFVFMKTEQEQMVLESPLAHAQFQLHDARVAALLFFLAQPRQTKETWQAFPEIEQGVISQLLALLLCGRFVTVLDEEGRLGEERNSLRQWNPCDLYFHSRSRLGRHANPFGDTFRFLGKIDPLPPVKPPLSPKGIPLFRPDMEGLKTNDLSFTEVLETRRSIRHFGNRPIRLRQLGEFLYRSARIRSFFQEKEKRYECSNRPYPGGGACYELEFYIVCHQCEGLAAGLYHYDPNDHQLHQLPAKEEKLEVLLDNAALVIGRKSTPQILIVFAARFHRMFWKYEGMGYAAILKDVGVVFQTMNLVATAMGLASCPLGGGNSDVFAAAAGTDYFEETSVGEFLLGSRDENATI